MNIFPAIDLFQGKAVRLYKGDTPPELARDFLNKGAKFIHLVDLEGAKSGKPENLETIKRIIETGDLFVEAGGGIRSVDTVEAYLSIGVNRVILGTAAVTDPDFLKNALERYGEKIAVGVDIKDGFVAIKGWTEKSQLTAEDFFVKMEKLGVSTVICTDISKDGAMQGTNRELYRLLSSKYSIRIIASGGVSSMEDIRQLREMDLYGAIIGKAYYVGAIDLKEAIEVAV